MMVKEDHQYQAFDTLGQDLGSRSAEVAPRPAVGMLVNSLGDPYTDALVGGVVDCAASDGFDLLIYVLDGIDDPHSEMGSFGIVHPERHDGLILTGSVAYYGKRSETTLRVFLERIGPLPVVGISLWLPGIPAVNPDSYGGMRKVVEHLLDVHHHRRLGFIEGPAGSPEAEERQRAFHDALEGRGVMPDPALMVAGDFTLEGGRSAMRTLLARGEALEAVVCANDETAIGVSEVLHSRGLRIPDDVALVGFDDIDASFRMPASLTTVRQPIREIGHQAAAELYALIQGGETPGSIVVPTHPVLRRSCGCLPAYVNQISLHKAPSVEPVSFAKERSRIVAALQEAGGSGVDWGELAEAFWHAVHNAESSQCLDILLQLMQDRPPSSDLLPPTGFDNWHAVISELRRSTLPLLSDRDIQVRAEDLFQQARALVSEVQLHAQTYRRRSRQQQEATLQAFSDRLANVVQLSVGAPLISEILSKLRLRRCHLALFEDAGTGARWRDAMYLPFSYVDGAVRLSVEQAPHSVREMLVSELWDQAAAARPAGGLRMALLPLYVGDESLGVGLFEGPAAAVAFYSRLRHVLSGLVHRMRLSESQRAARKEAESARVEADLALRDALAAQRRYAESAWQAVVGGSTSDFVRGYVWTPDGASSDDDAWLPVMSRVAQSGDTILEDDRDNGQMLGVPLTLFGEEIIGSLGFSRSKVDAEDQPGGWTPEQIRLVENVARHVAQALETHRLVSDARRRAARLAAAAEVSSAATSITDLDELLSGAVRLIQARFDLAYAGLFLVDDARRWAVLVAGTGEAGQIMLAREHKLEVGGQSMIGTCIATGEARIAADTALETVWQPNPLLPETRSELALPLISRAKVIGAMTIQDRRSGAFSEEDVTALQTMADQLANAIENARLIAQMARSLRELEVATGRFTGQAWREFIVGQDRRLGFRHRLVDTVPAEDPHPEAAAAIARSEAVVAQLLSGADASAEPGDPAAGSVEGGSRPKAERVGEARAGLGVPIRLRNQVLGALNLRFEEDYVAPETVQMVEQIADRLAIALESARLLETSRWTAERERMAREITDRLRGTLDWDELMQTAVSEIGEAVDASRVFVQWTPLADDTRSSDDDIPTEGNVLSRGGGVEGEDL